MSFTLHICPSHWDVLHGSVSPFFMASQIIRHSLGKGMIAVIKKDTFGDLPGVVVPLSM